MSKAVITRLFVAAFVAAAAGIVVGIVELISAIAQGVVTFGGSQVVHVDGTAFAAALPWLAIASLAILGGGLAAVASWVGALLNTAQLEDKTWFVVLLLLGLFSLGWVAMLAYVIAGPDGTRPGELDRGIAVAPGA